MVLAFSALLYGLLKFSKIMPENGVLFVVCLSMAAGFIAVYLVTKTSNKSDKIKIGIDIHGMIDYDPHFFAVLSKALVESGHEVHIMTGSEIQPAIIAELRGYGIMWTDIFSISDYYKNKPEVQLWRDERGRPWVAPELWNQAKGLYAQERGLDLVLDDTAEYGEHFSTSFGYCKIINKTGKHKGPKAIMPEPPKVSLKRIIPHVPASDRETLNLGKE